FALARSLQDDSGSSSNCPRSTAGVSRCSFHPYLVLNGHQCTHTDEIGVRNDSYGSSIAKPGSCLPSRYSRLAPPPVEMWSKADSSSSMARIAAAESPPPTTLNAPDSAIASATVRVPAAKASN